MPSSSHPTPETVALSDGVGHRRRLRLSVTGGLTLASILVFWTTDLDLWMAGMFFDAGDPANAWPDQWDPLWRFFYFAVPMLTTLLATGSIVALWMSWASRRFRDLRLPAALMLLTLVVGPGLLINVLSKDNWGRPRPREVEQFNGPMQYLPPLAIGDSKAGKSFGAGHASVGYSLLVVWLLYRRQLPGLAWVAFGVSIVLGSLMGVGRMAAGAHFLSDVLWSGYLTFLSAWILYHYVLHIPEREGLARSGATNSDRSFPGYYGYSMMGAVVVSGLLAFLPIQKELHYCTQDTTSSLPPVLRLELDRVDLEILFDEEHRNGPCLEGSMRGFGFPNHRVRSFGRLEDRGESTLVVELEQRGFFTRLDTRLTLHLNPSQLERLEVRLAEGDIRVRQIDPGELPILDLETARGRVFASKRNVGLAPSLLDGVRGLGNNRCQLSHDDPVAGDGETGRQRW